MKWYDVKAKTNDVYIYDEIGAWGVPASEFIAEIRNLKGALNLYINSPGGDAFAGIAIYNALARHDGAVNVTVDGIAASIASVIAQAGDTRTMAKSSALMIHDAWGLAVGNAETMAKMQGELDDLSNSIADIYAAKAGGSPEMWRTAMQTETWYRADDAVTAGLADVAVSPAPSAYSSKVFNLSNYKQVPEWVNQGPDPEPTPTPEPVPEPEKEDDMADDKEVRQALGIDGEADPVKAINGLQAQVAALKATIASDAPEKGEIATVRAELQEANQRLLSADSEHAAGIVTLREKVRNMEATHKVDQAVAVGRITPANRDLALRVALNETDEGWASFVASLPHVDLAERGTSGMDLSDFEPTSGDIAAAKLTGSWNDNDPDGSRRKIRDFKAQKAGVKS